MYLALLIKTTPQTFTKWMCICIIFPRFGSDKTDKGLIPKTFSTSAEKFTLPKEQVDMDIALLHIQGLILRFFKRCVFCEPSGLQWSCLRKHCWFSSRGCRIGALQYNQSQRWAPIRNGLKPQRPRLLYSYVQHLCLANRYPLAAERESHVQDKSWGFEKKYLEILLSIRDRRL